MEIDHCSQYVLLFRSVLLYAMCTIVHNVYYCSQCVLLLTMDTTVHNVYYC